jgi:putative transposase
MASPRVKTTEESGLIQGYDGGQQVKGRKRPRLVDTLGLLLSVEVTPAHTSDQEGPRRVLIGLKPLQPRLELSWADRADGGEPLATWGAAEGAWRVEIITRVPYVQGFVVRPWCWMVERTLGWIGWQRRFSKDYERKVQMSEPGLQLAMIRLMVRRLARSRDSLGLPRHREASRRGQPGEQDPLVEADLTPKGHDRELSSTEKPGTRLRAHA